MKRITAFLTAAILMLGMNINGLSAEKEGVIKAISQTLLNSVPNPSVAQTGGDWSVLGLARSNIEVPRGYFDLYYENVCKLAAKTDGVLNERKYSENARVVLALSAIGKNPMDCGGIDLVTPLLSYDKVVAQGINGPIFALISLNCRDFNINTEEAEEKYISLILDAQNDDGGFPLSKGGESDADVTAMAVCALAEYKNTEKIQASADKALTYLSVKQNEDGSFSSQNVKNAESCAQVLVALSAWGIDEKDTRFIKNGKSVYDGLMNFYIENEGFSHLEEKKLSIMATEQAFIALLARENKSFIYDMRDVENSETDLKPDFGLAGKNEVIKPMPVVAEGKPFLDIGDNRYKSDIEKLAERNIINGRTEEQFCPDALMSRAEFAAITVKALGLERVGADIFKDVNSRDWHFDFVSTAYKYGIIKGVSPDEFAPDSVITRQQALVMAERIAVLCGNNTNLDETMVGNVLAQFDDCLSVSDWARKSVAWCVQNGIISSDEMELKPDESIKRDEVAHIIRGVMEISLLIGE